MSGVDLSELGEDLGSHLQDLSIWIAIAPEALK